jgi:hypothetical protein
VQLVPNLSIGLLLLLELLAQVAGLVRAPLVRLDLGFGFGLGHCSVFGGFLLLLAQLQLLRGALVFGHT